MGSEWKEIPFNELGEVNRGRSRHRPRYAEHLYGGPYPFIQTGDVRESGGRITTHTQTYSEAGLEQSRLWPEGTMCITIAANIAETGILTYPACFPDSVVGFIADENICDVRFVEYNFRLLKRRLQSEAIGSVQDNINLATLARLNIPIPPLPEQKAIAHILGTLDDKIELNRRMNATLEGMAQALFKSWFVDFDPVLDNAILAGNPVPEEFAERAKVRRAILEQNQNDECSMMNDELKDSSIHHSSLKTHHSPQAPSLAASNPIPDELAPRAEVRKKALASNQASLSAEASAKAGFPAAFEYDDELGPIPEGWTLQSFQSLATLDTESVKPFEQPSTVWEHYSIPSFDSSGMPRWDRGDEIKSNKYRVKPGAILSSKLNPETERTWWPFMLDAETAICSTEFMQFVPKNLDEQAFVYSLIRSEPFQANILERVTGSTGSRQRAQPKEIAKIGVLDCGAILRAEFTKVALPLFQSIRNNSLRNQTLTTLRDTLLPKLISGELRLSETEPLTEKTLA